MPIGVRVTLRSDRMYEFLDRLVSIALPASATSKALATNSMVVATTRLVLPSRLSFLKS